MIHRLYLFPVGGNSYFTDEDINQIKECLINGDEENLVVFNISGITIIDFDEKIMYVCSEEEQKIIKVEPILV